MSHRNSCRFGALAAVLALPICVTAAATDTTPVPIGGEIPVNTLVRASQLEVIARDAYGNFVIAWTGVNLITNQSSIWARRYSATGVPLSGEFRVDSGAASYESQPAIAMAPTGEFVIVWTEGNGLRARRYDARGLALGADFALNGDGPASSLQNVPRAAILPDGGFVVAWQDAATSNSYFDVFVRRYDANGQPLGAAVRANTYTGGYQDKPALAVGADGRYIVAWNSDSQEGPQGSADAPGVYAQRFNPDGSRAGVEFRVAQSTAGAQGYPSLAYRPDGGFTVVWSGAGDAAPQGNTFLRRFDAAGQALGDELILPQDQTLWHSYGTVAIDRLGREIVTWMARPSQERFDLGSIWLRRFDTDGTPMGDQIEASVTDGTVDVPRAASLDADGDFVVLWARSDVNSIDSNLNLYFRRFRSAEPVDVGLNVSGDVGAVLPGATVNLQFTVQNEHTSSNIPGVGSSTGVSLTLNKPSGAQLLSLDGGADWNCTTALSLSCTLNTAIDAGATAPPLHLALRAPLVTGTMTLSSTVQADQSDPLEANNARTLQLQVDRNPQTTDPVPDPFGFVDQDNVPLVSAVPSNVITVSGINQPTTITISGADASYSINGGAFVNTASTVKAGDHVQLQIKTWILPFATKSATVSIGGVTDQWQVRTGLRLW